MTRLTLGNKSGDTAYQDNSKVPIEQIELIQRCITGETAAWDKLISQNQQCVFGFAYKLCRNYDDASDITAQVFVRLYLNLQTFRSESSFASWLFRIARNVYLDLCIRPHYRSNVSLDTGCDSEGGATQFKVRDVADLAPSPEDQCINRDTSRLLSRAISFLPAYQRVVLRMYHSEGKTYEQISQSIGQPIGTVKSRLNRARMSLRERLMPAREMLLSA